MKYLSLFIILLLFPVHSCKKDNIEPDPSEEPSGDQTLAEAIIGAQGGKLETEDFTLTVPEEAFDTNVTLKLYREEHDTLPGSTKVSSTYRIEGLSTAWNKPLTLEIKYIGTLVEESYIAIGYKHYIEEQEDTVLVNELLNAVDSSGVLKCTLPAHDHVNSSVKSSPAGEPYIHPFFLQSALLLNCITNIATYQSECAEIKYNAENYISQEKIGQFAGDMDEAVSLFHALGLIDSNVLNKHKIRVFIFKDPDRASYPTFVEPDIELPPLTTQEFRFNTINSLFKFNIPENLFEGLYSKNLRMIAGEGVFRYETYCLFSNKKNWLHWALNCWVREYFYGSHPEFENGEIPNTFLIHPFYGMNANKREDIEFIPFGSNRLREPLHGIGMSSLIKYLMENYNENLDLLAKMYAELQDPSGTKHPIDAILNSVDEPEYIWLPGFFKSYLGGHIWNISGEKFMDKIDFNDEVHFVDETDTVKYFDRSYPDLSAGLCQVNLSPNLSELVLDESDKLNFKLGPESLNLDYVTVLIFAYKEGHLTFLDEGIDVTIDSIKARIDNGYTTLLAAVVNCANEYPYTGDLDIDLTIKMIGKKTWPWKYVTIDAVVTDAIFKSSSGDESFKESHIIKLTDRLVEVSEDGTRFTANWIDQTADYKFEGGVDITVDIVTSEITGFSLWSNTESISDNTVTLSERTEISSKKDLSIPVVYWDNDYLSHQLSGEEVCTTVEKWTYSYRMYPGQSYEYSNTLQSYSCNENANILFFWAREINK